jgi:hypothetical protein
MEPMTYTAPELPGTPWYFVCAAYPTESMMRGIHRVAETDLFDRFPASCAVIGTAPMDDAEGYGTGAPDGTYSVVVMTMDPAAADHAVLLLEGGVRWQPVEGFAHALVLRRLRLIVQAKVEGRGDERVIFHNGEPRVIRQDGSMTPRRPR